MLTLFYIDDSKDDLFYVEYICKKQKLEIDVFCFISADYALQALERRIAENMSLPEILIADLYMPLDSGIELISRPRADARFSAMRLGICSGSDAREDRERSLASGAHFFLEKPLALASLMRNHTL